MKKLHYYFGNIKILSILLSIFAVACGSKLIIPIVKDARTHGIALEYVGSNSVVSYSVISNKGCQASCIEVKTLEQKVFDTYSQASFVIDFLSFDHQQNKYWSISNNSKKLSKEIELIKYFLPILISSYQRIYSTANSKLIIKIHFLPNNVQINDLIIKEEGRGVITYHYVFYTNSFQTASNKSDVSLEEESPDFVSYTAVSMAVLAHELSHIAQFDIKQQDQEGESNLDIVNNEARARMFEIYTLAVLFAEYRQDFSDGYSVIIGNRSNDTKIKHGLSIKQEYQNFSSDIDYTSIKPYELGYRLGEGQLIRVARKNKLQSDDIIALKAIENYLITNLQQNIDLSKEISEHIENN